MLGDQDVPPSNISSATPTFALVPAAVQGTAVQGALGLQSLTGCAPIPPKVYPTSLNTASGTTPMFTLSACGPPSTVTRVSPPT